MTRVIVVDDSPDIRSRVVGALKELERIEVVGEFESSAGAVDFTKGHTLDVVVLDDRLKQGSGLEVLRFVKEECPDVKVIVFSAYAEPYQRDMYLRAGAHAFLAKASGLDGLLNAIHDIEQNAPANRTGEARPSGNEHDEGNRRSSSGNGG